jgi:hypothetical protein
MVSSSEAITNKNSTFTADLLNQTLQGAKSKYLDSISITTSALQNGGTAVTMANLIGLINRVTVSVAGTVEVDLSQTDLYALNQLWLSNTPRTKVGAGDNQQCIISGLQLPLWFPAVANETQVSFYYSAVTNADSTSISSTANYQGSIPRNTALHYTKYSQNTSGVDSSSLGNWDHQFQALGNISGVMFNMSTIAGGSTLIADSGLQQVGIEIDGVNNVLLYEVNELTSLRNVYTGQLNTSLEDSPGSTAILDNYFWLPIAEHIPKNANVRINGMAGVNAETVSDIVIQQIPY